MPQIGAGRISLKDGLWRGMTTQSKSKAGSFELLENCYVSSDGQEIRTMPGYICVIDPETQARKNDGTDTTTGYRTTHVDSRRPVHTTSGSYTIETTPTEQMRIWTEPRSLHLIEQVSGRWLIVGESDFRREPLAVTPGGTDWASITTIAVSGGFVQVTVSGGTGGSAQTFNNAHNSDVKFRVWISGSTGALASTVNDRGHTVTAVAGNVLTLGTAAGGGTGTGGFIAKVTMIGDDSNQPISDDRDGLTVWTSLDLGDPDAANPSETVYVSHVSNRMRDFGDSTGNLREGNRSNTAGHGTTYPRSRRRQLRLPYRLCPHIAGNRLILAAPGYGCVFQVPSIVPINYDEVTLPLGIRAIANDIYDRPQALGVPKAVAWEDNDKAPSSTWHGFHNTTATAFGGTGQPERNGTYKFRFAYRNEATGEIGLWSEPVVLQSASGTHANYSFRIPVYYPGYLMHESLATSILVWRTKQNGEEYYFDSTLDLVSPVFATARGGPISRRYGLNPDSSTHVDAGDYWHHTVYVPNWVSDDDLDLGGEIQPVINEMPMGCKAARTIRGWTMFGGALGDTGSLQQLQSGTLSLYYDPSANFYNAEREIMMSRHSASTGGNIPTPFEGVDGQFGCAKRGIPPSYSGQFIVSRDMMPFEKKIVRFSKLRNTLAAWSSANTWDAAVNNPYAARGRMPDIHYEMESTPLLEGSDFTAATSSGADAWLVLPRGLLQISEPDNPNITPDTNITLVSNEAEQDIEGIGDANGQAIICTRDRTYLLGFASSPIGVQPDIGSYKFGCIAPNSMVSYDGGCAWLSDRGPVAIESGGFKWIGQDLERLFHGESARYKRDSKGMMRHSWACHDAERGLLYFGVFADRFNSLTGEVTVSWQDEASSYEVSPYTWTTASDHADADKILSRFPCDEVLVYNYRVEAWSVWRPPHTIAIQWMTTGKDANGNDRVFFLGNDRRIYAMDDAWGIFEKESGFQAITDTGTLSTLTIPTTAAARAGVPVAIYDASQRPHRLKYFGTILSVGSGTITLDASVAVTTSDVIWMGARSMTVRSNYVNFKGSDYAQLPALGSTFDQWSLLAAKGSGEVQSVFTNARARARQELDGVESIPWSPLTSGDTGYLDYSYGGLSLPGAPPNTRAYSLGMSAGQDMQFDLTFVGGAQVRLNNLFVEVQ